MTARALLLLGIGVAGLTLLGPGCDDEARPAPTVIVADIEAGRPAPADWRMLVDLAGDWAFRIGDDSTWAGGTGWDRVAVPGAWEDAGYHGYDGTAWYRTSFVLDPEAASLAGKAPPFLLLGRIDDVDEVWLNGERLGESGRRPPEAETGATAFQTAAFSFRVYRVPSGLLRADRPNDLAVRVFDAELEGGILEGPLALAIPTAANPAGLPVVADLVGVWRFSLGDGLWADPDLDDTGWATIRVPGTWQGQDFGEPGGFAWYRTRATLSKGDASRDLVLVFGAIDDLDEAFVNGVRVGGTGDLNDPSVQGDEWLRERAYPVPASALRDGENVVAVRVFDGLVEGGIHRGPVALMTPEAYAERRRRLLDDRR